MNVIADWFKARLREKSTFVGLGMLFSQLYSAGSMSGVDPQAVCTSLGFIMFHEGP